MEKIVCKPFLRWAGGKRWLLKDIDTFLPKKNINQYHEPFIGGGSMFFHLQYNNSCLSDLNSELIETYISVRDEIEGVIENIKTFKKTKEEYYKIRKLKPQSSSRKAARFIYLNHMSFNGIYRVNLKGEYNVPYGYREHYNFEFENLIKVSKALKNVNLEEQDFYKIIDNVQKNDLVFLDPPYTVTHNNNGFVQYNQKIFSLNSQYKLAQMINEIKEIGAYYILTNAAHPTVKEIFDNGDKMIEISRASLVGGKNAKRGKYEELIITNGGE